MPIEDWDDAYANGAYIDDAEQIVEDWARMADRFRREHLSEELCLRPGQRPFVDLYRPHGAVQGLTFIIHGGYWMAFSGRAFAHLAAGPLARGQAVAMVSYTLAPDARIAGITTEIAACLADAASRIDGPIHLAGHSAGGHLASRMMCEGVLPDVVAARIRHTLSISGLHDLRPLLRTKMNDTLRLTDAEAATESPALLRPRPGARITCAVGAEERPEFLRQTALLCNIWHGLGADITELILPGTHHFSVIDGLTEPDSTLTSRLLD